jgi:Toprim-like/Protein of unknown function (DUF3991)
LEVVATNLGLEPDRHDSHKWRDAGHIISIDGSKFMDWAADKGEGGAIDLVMHVQGVEFKEAVQWLSGRSLQPPHCEAQPAANREPRILEMPASNEQRWAAVREYLVETRKLPGKAIDHLHERNLIYADDMQNAVFARHSTYSDNQTWQRGDTTGASLRGTWGENNQFHGLAQGTIREDGWFWVGVGQGTVQRVLLTESPIDALSLMVLDKPHRKSGNVTIYLSTDGAGLMPIEALLKVMESGGQVAVAFDADRAGELMAWRVARELPRVRRVTPAFGKDWNERLVWGGRQEQAPHQTEEQRSIKALWQWHSAAQKLGRSPQYLQRIVEVAKGVVQGEALSGKGRNAMQQDLAALKQRRLSLGDTLRSSVAQNDSLGRKSAGQGDRENGIE